MRKKPAPRQFSFQSKLERISPDASYFALSVPLKVSRALGTRGPVPVSARVDDSTAFLVSLFPVGEGRHYLRVKAAIRNETRIKEGDRVRVRIAVRDRAAESSIPADLASALRSEGVLEDFKALPLGRRTYLMRWIGEAAKPQTRGKRIGVAVEAAHLKRERRMDRSD